MKDILIASIDNLKGFGDAIEDLFPQTDVQLCLVHQMRNSMKYITWKDLRACVKDVKQIYTAVNEERDLDYTILTKQKKNGVANTALSSKAGAVTGTGSDLSLPTHPPSGVSSTPPIR